MERTDEVSEREYYELHRWVTVLLYPTGKLGPTKLLLKQIRRFSFGLVSADLLVFARVGIGAPIAQLLGCS